MFVCSVDARRWWFISLFVFRCDSVVFTHASACVCSPNRMKATPTPSSSLTNCYYLLLNILLAGRAYSTLRIQAAYTYLLGPAYCNHCSCNRKQFQHLCWNSLKLAIWYSLNNMWCYSLLVLWILHQLMLASAYVVLTGWRWHPHLRCQAIRRHQTCDFCE